MPIPIIKNETLCDYLVKRLLVDILLGERSGRLLEIKFYLIFYLCISYIYHLNVYNHFQYPVMLAVYTSVVKVSPTMCYSIIYIFFYFFFWHLNVSSFILPVVLSQIIFNPQLV